MSGERAAYGACKAIRLGVALCALLLCAALLGCVVPEDIKQRPQSDTGEGDYWPDFVNPQPVSQGKLLLPASCTGYTFKIMLTALPPADDTLYQDFEVRWFLDYDAVSNPHEVGYSRSRELVHSQALNLKEIALAGGESTHIMEVLVSDRGFEDSNVAPAFRKTVAKAHTALYTWVFTLGDDSVESCQ